MHATNSSDHDLVSRSAGSREKLPTSQVVGERMECVARREFDTRTRENAEARMSGAVKMARCKRGHLTKTITH